MCSDARDDNIYIYSGSSYRSYTYQDNLYKTRVYTEGIDYADSEIKKNNKKLVSLTYDVFNNKVSITPPIL